MQQIGFNGYFVDCICYNYIFGVNQQLFTLNLSQLHENYRKYSDSSNERNKTHLFINFVFLYQLHYLKNTEAFMMLYFIIVWLISKQE